MKSFINFPRADNVELTNVHSLYRVHEVPGMRNAESYDGTGIKKTYNLAKTDRDYPTEIEAVPALIEIKNGSGKMMRKKVSEVTAVCPECEKSGIVDPQKKEKFCPECGMVLGRGDEIDSEAAITPHLTRTPEAAGFYGE